ncbi:MAG: hypothetical protein HYT87_03060 [Nitrospirae bacterium]|nr:hypothetical protein [Nitrospirota bacterium]
MRIPKGCRVWAPAMLMFACAGGKDGIAPDSSNRPGVDSASSASSLAFARLVAHSSEATVGEEYRTRNVSGMVEIFSGDKLRSDILGGVAQASGRSEIPLVTVHVAGTLPAEFADALSAGLGGQPRDYQYGLTLVFPAIPFDWAEVRDHPALQPLFPYPPYGVTRVEVARVEPDSERPMFSGSVSLSFNELILDAELVAPLLPPCGPQPAANGYPGGFPIYCEPYEGRLWGLRGRPCGSSEDCTLGPPAPCSGCSQPFSRTFLDEAWALYAQTAFCPHICPMLIAPCPENPTAVCEEGYCRIKAERESGLPQVAVSK